MSADAAEARRRRLLVGWLLVIAAVAAFTWLVMQQELWANALAAVYPNEPQPVFRSATIAELTLQHLWLVGFSSLLTIAVGVPLGIWVTWPSGREFRPLVSAVVDIGQTFPPVAVLALAMPLLGLGFVPTVTALFLYGLFPVVNGTISGIESVPHAVIDSANGMGMGRARILFRVELPLAARVILAGIRTSVIINVGTATVGAAFGAGGLGGPIIGGLLVQNEAYITEGAVGAALLAVLLDTLLAQVERSVTPAGTA